MQFKAQLKLRDMSFEMKINLIVSEESLGSGPFSCNPSVPGGGSNTVLSGVLQGEGTTVDGQTQNDLPGWETTLDPVVYCRVLIGEGICYGGSLNLLPSCHC